jgi:PIN domain nuclease of toxin-antitoxin system
MHQNSFDRLMIAQALEEDLVLLTRDPWPVIHDPDIRAYPGPRTLW